MSLVDQTKTVSIQIGDKKVLIGCDHAGFELKNYIIAQLRKNDSVVIDIGTNNPASVDYPDYAHALAKEMRDGVAEFGILICGSANGMAMTANKYSHIRAAVCWTQEIAKLAREHNQANVVCVPARFLKSKEQGMSIVKTFLNTPTCSSTCSSNSSESRHQRRVLKINKI